MPGTYVVIVAAGRGARMGGTVPKQYRDLAGRPVLRRSIDAFLAVPGVAGIRVAIHPDDRPLYDAATVGLGLLPPVAGGTDRQESVLNALESLAPLAPDAVLIHDAARPLVDRGTIQRTIDAFATADGALAALPVTDSLHRAGDGSRAAGPVDRSNLWRAQTPQGFRFAALLSAHRTHRGAALGDDAAVAEAAGLDVRLAIGSAENIKITTEEDLRHAERLLMARLSDLRTGHGYDVHRFGPGDHVMLCGVRIAHDRGLIGHSDADVGLHALVDALLGAIGAGDIGVHFPPSDPRWRGADSAGFLRHAASLVAARGGEVRHIDVTLVCEGPRIGPHREAMIARVADVLGIDRGRVSVKATTTEGLGFTGRHEGIAAHAVATVALPI